MTVEELIRRARVRLHDSALPYLISDEDMVVFVGNAQREACERGLALFDDTTTAICEISVEAAQATYPTDERVLAVVSARLDGETEPLRKVNADDVLLHKFKASLGSATPTAFYERDGAITLLPTPDASDTLRLAVYRYPLADIESISDDLEIPARLHPALIHWVCYEALSVQDAELLDPGSAEKALLAFERVFGRPRTALELKSWRELARNTGVRIRTL